MVLLDRVTAWDETHITGTSQSHRNPNNPLRRQGVLCAVCGIEYAAQAMALHGALVAGTASRPGVLASLRSVKLHVPRLDDIAEDLTITAESLLGRSDSFIYRFSLRGAGVLLLEGQASVFLR